MLLGQASIAPQACNWQATKINTCSLPGNSQSQQMESLLARVGIVQRVPPYYSIRFNISDQEGDLPKRMGSSRILFAVEA